MSISTGPKIPVMVKGDSGDTYLTQGNALLRMLQALIQGNVINLTTFTPPASPNNGDTYIVAAVATGAWTGKETNVAYWSTDNPAAPSGEWEFFVPVIGWVVGNQADGLLYIFTSNGWIPFTSFYGAHGEHWVHGYSTEEITLNIGGTTTDSAANLLPANSLIESVVARVTTTITALATTWEVGDPTTAARFISPDATLAAGETQVGLNHMQGSIASDAAGPVQTAAAKIRITTDANPGAGKVRVTVFYKQFIAPTS